MDRFLSAGMVVQDNKPLLEASRKRRFSIANAGYSGVFMTRAGAKGDDKAGPTVMMAPGAESFMSMPVIRPAILGDLPALTDIYNHYVVNTAITFDLHPLSPEERRPWFDDHGTTGRHRLIVAVNDEAAPLGYATTSRWRPKAAYDTTVEASVYCHPAAVGRGCGTALYAALFESIATEDVHRIVAGVSLPNPVSIALHERFGFHRVGIFEGVGRKFNQYWDVAWFERPLKR
jgi:phosphinothricin acetyltransferase